MTSHAMPLPSDTGLYDARYEHDACGVGFVVNIDGARTHAIVEQGVLVLKNLLHRGASGGDKETGDGAGVLVQLPDTFLRETCARLGKAMVVGTTGLNQEQRAVIHKAAEQTPVVFAPT